MTEKSRLTMTKEEKQIDAVKKGKVLLDQYNITMGRENKIIDNFSIESIQLIRAEFLTTQYKCTLRLYFGETLVREYGFPKSTTIEEAKSLAYTQFYEEAFHIFKNFPIPKEVGCNGKICDKK